MACRGCSCISSRPARPRRPVLLQAVKVFQEQQPGCLLGVIQFGRASRLFPEDVVDILESLFEHGHLIFCGIGPGDSPTASVALRFGRSVNLAVQRHRALCHEPADASRRFWPLWITETTTARGLDWKSSPWRHGLLVRTGNDVEHLVEGTGRPASHPFEIEVRNDEIISNQSLRVLGRRLTNSSSTVCLRRPSSECESGNVPLISVSLRSTSCWRSDATRCARSKSLR